ncbi:MAG: archease [Candidatus Latescibacteria bacterium]|nr:archease [Candidatus Latescibacterota bacterium]
MPFEFIEDIAIADVAFRAWGASAEEVFTSAAAATLRVMVQDLGSIARRQERPLELVNSCLDLLLFDFLQELIYYKDAEGLLLLPEELRLQEGYCLRAHLWGERLDPSRHELLVDVKAVTLHLFSLVGDSEGWKAQVVLDI